MRSGALRASMPGREVRFYPALLSTDAAARAWAKEEAPSGAVVVADYQASPRGRAGVPWTIPPQGVGFSVVVRPGYLEHQEGRLYMASGCALSDVASRPRVTWPDQAWDDRRPLGAVAVYAEVALLQMIWAVVSFMIEDGGAAPESRIASVVDRFEARLDQTADGLAAAYQSRLATVGRRVVAHLIPMGPTGRRIGGIAVGVDGDGSLRIAVDEGRTVAVRPQHVGLLEVDQGSRSV